jgi:hypothetical protein
LDLDYPGKRRGLGRGGLDKASNLVVGSTDLDLYAVRLVSHPAAESVPVGQLKDERPEPNSLHNSPDMHKNPSLVNVLLHTDPFARFLGHTVFLPRGW